MSEKDNMHADKQFEPQRARYGGNGNFQDGDTPSQKSHFAVKDFLKGKMGYGFEDNQKRNPWEYDFKFEYRNFGKTVYDYKYFNLDAEPDPLIRFMKYKGNTSLFDCDGSGAGNEAYLCSLSRDIYRVLWGWNDSIGTTKKDNKNAEVYFIVKRYADSLLEKNKDMGPDTMNSFKSVICSCKLTKKHVNWEAVREFAELNQTLGNFTLVPAYFNTYRNSHTNPRDSWFESLNLLKSKEKDDTWLQKGNQIVWDSKDFTKYINTFFLWDYVEIDREKGGYKVKNDRSYDAIKSNILRRGIFMTYMLRIALDAGNNNEKINPNKDGITKIYKVIREKVFCTDCTFHGYDCVMCYIQKAISDSKCDEEEKKFATKMLNECKTKLIKLRCNGENGDVNEPEKNQ